MSDPTSPANRKAALLIGRLFELKAADKPPRSIVVLPAGDQLVDQVNPDGAPYKLRVNPSVLSAKRMEAARQLVARDARQVQPYFDYNHEDKEASGYPKRFWWKDGLGVMADVEWTQSAVAKITGATPEFQAFSPRIPIDEETGEALGLFLNSGGLVNRPLFGAKTKISVSADELELVAADPNAVELVSALEEDGEPAPQIGTEQRSGDGAVIGRELIGFAVGCGILAPAERDEWERRMTKDRAGWTRELLAKSPTVLIGKFIKDQAVGATGRSQRDWKREARELIAQDPQLKKLAESDPDAAMSRAIELINARNPQRT